jgi:hypothetical protein
MSDTRKSVALYAKARRASLNAAADGRPGAPTKAEIAHEANVRAGIAKHERNMYGIDRDFKKLIALSLMSSDDVTSMSKVDKKLEKLGTAAGKEATAFRVKAAAKTAKLVASAETAQKRLSTHIKDTAADMLAYRAANLQTIADKSKGRR